MEDYYSILLIDRNSTTTEIKLSYKKLALKYHPDRNKEEGAEEHFKKISEAYQVLSDENKRIIYDNSGNLDFSFDDPLVLFQRLFPNIPPEVVHIGCNIIKQIQENEDFDMNTIRRDRKLQQEIIDLTNILTDQIPEPIKNIFNLLRKDIPETEKRRKDEDNMLEKITSSEINVNSKENTEKEIENQVIENTLMEDNRCVETDTNVDETNNECVVLDTYNSQLQDIDYGEMMLDIHQEINVELEDIINNDSISTSIMVLRYCNNLELDCKICSGKGYYLVKKHFKIPTSYRHIQLLNEGHHNDKEKGNLFIRLNINPHPKYRIVNEYDLINEIDVTIYDLYFGNTIYIPYFDKNIGLRISREMKNNSMTKCIENLGLPKKDGRGKLYIAMNLVFPDNIRDDIIEKYFPQISNYYDDLDISKTLEIYRV